MARFAIWTVVAAVAACGPARRPPDAPSTATDATDAPATAPAAPAHRAQPAPPRWELAQQWDLGGGEQPHSVFVAMEGDTIAIYARLTRAARTVPMLVVYHREMGRWAEAQRLVVPQPPGDGDFTLDLALDGDTLLVGNVVLARREGAWAVEQVLASADDGTALEPGGLSGDTIVARGGDGSVRVWGRTAGRWTQQQVLRGAPGEDFAARGYRTVAIDGDVIAVGAFWGGPGRVYLYRRAGSRWALEQRLEPPDDEGRAFGFAVAIDGDTVGVLSDGTSHLITAGRPLTRAFAFARGQWAQQGKLEGPGRSAGSDIAIAGDELAYGLGYRGDMLELHVAQRRDGAWSAPSTLRMRGAAPARWGQYRSFALTRTDLAVATVVGGAARVYLYEKR